MTDVDKPDGRSFVSAADERLAAAYDPPMGIVEYVDHLLENPLAAARSARYLLAAIESCGTREVHERGERLVRYRFFDDPANDGEHAVLGNTAALNAFVDDLRAAAAGRGNDEKIAWIDGPTATGKSEFKRCLINGLREFSRTDAGRRYTIEWNVTGTSSNRSLSYGDGGDTSEWYRSPVQSQPLSVFPAATRERIAEAVSDAGDASDVEAVSDPGAQSGRESVSTEDTASPMESVSASDDTPEEGSRDGLGPGELAADVDLDPFSTEAYDRLESTYRERGHDEPFAAATDRDHLRVRSYVVDVGQGIGVLHAEDDGTPKERLVGSWMGSMLRELDSRGRKNPQAFSYDGVLSQGNGVATIVEDASQHADLLRRLLNVPDERRVKLDKGIGMDVDTQLIVISNPDLDAELDRHAEREGADPLKALKRRLSRHEFRYLTDRRLEAELLRREITGETRVPEAAASEPVRGSGSSQDGSPTADPVRAPLTVRVRDEDGVQRERELAPHALGAAALYAVVTRLHAEELPAEIDLIEKALLYESGELRRADDRITIDDVDPDPADRDGRTGIPVTYTRDVIAELLGSDADRSHPELAVERVVTPSDVLEAMVSGLSDAPVFSRAEVAEYEERREPVAERVRTAQREDVIDAMLAEETVSEETVAEYVEHVYAWDADDPVETERGPTEPDALAMKVFETETLGRFSETDYRGTSPSREVATFRRERVIQGLTRYAWQHRGDEFAIDDVDLSEIPELKAVLEANELADIKRRYPDLDPHEWADPPADTETDRLKTETIDRLIDRGYSHASAELTSRSVMRDIREEWESIDVDADGGGGPNYDAGSWNRGDR